MKRDQLLRAAWWTFAIAFPLMLTILGVVTFIAQDLMIYRQAGVFLWEGRDPYQLPQFTQYATDIGFGPVDPGVLQIWTPPFSLFLPLFLGLFTPETSKYLWIATYSLSVLCGITCCRRLVGGKRNRYVEALMIVGFLPIIFHGIVWGAVAPFEILPFFLLIITLSRGSSSSFVITTCLFLMMFKPQLVLAPLLLLMIRGLQNRTLIRSAFFAGTLVVMAILLTLSLRRDILSDYLETDRSVFLLHSQYTVSLPTILGAQPWESLKGYCLLALIFLAVGSAVSRQIRHLSLAQQLVEVSPLTFLIIPYCWAHDMLAILPWALVVAHENKVKGFMSLLISCILPFGLWIAGGFYLSRDLAGGHVFGRYFMIAAILLGVGIRFVRRRDVRMKSPSR